MSKKIIIELFAEVQPSPSPEKGSSSLSPLPISNIKTFGFFTFPAANRIAGTRLCHGFLSFSLGLLKVFDHLLEFRV